MAAKHEGADIHFGDAEFLGKELAETGRIEHAGHPDHHMVGQA